MTISRWWWALVAAGVLALIVTVVLLTRGLTPAAVLPVDDSAPQGQPGTVLLVPGYGGSTGALSRLAGSLAADGRTAQVVALPGDGTGDLTVQARTLSARIDAALAAGAPSVDLVGYSAGGVVVRDWVREHPEQARREVRRMVTLGSPHHGTAVAGLASALLPGACPLACQQLAPNSELLTTLNTGDETPTLEHWLSVWTSSDIVVTPPDSARLAGAVNVPVQSVCSDARVTHATLPTDPLVTGLVRRALAVEPLTEVPTAAECASLRAG